LRTACDLELSDTLTVQRPDGFAVPSLADLEKELPALIKAAAKGFASPAETAITYEEATAKKSKSESVTDGTESAT
jgi:hypothetical protein